LFLEKHRSSMNENMIPGIKTSLRVDGDVTMGVVADLKTQLRKSGQLLVNYSAKPKT